MPLITGQIFTTNSSGVTSWQNPPFGATGFMGSTGFTGSTGLIGVTGLIGATGFRGSTGFNGATGFLGTTGLSGFNGTTGLRGETGFVGPTGIIGTTGFTGMTGFPGGSTGETGFQGETGFNGPTGLKGPNGLIGMTGFQGTTGFIGSTGPDQGPRGPTGLTGPAGTSGSLGPVSSAVNYFESVIPNSASPQSIPPLGTANIIYPTNILNNGWIIGGSPSNTVFTCPVTGVYLLLSTTCLFLAGGSPNTISIVQNGSTVPSATFTTIAGFEGKSFTFTYLMPIAQGDTISINVLSQSLPGGTAIRGGSTNTSAIAGSLAFVKIA